MNKPLKSMAEIRQMVGQARSSLTAAPTTSPLKSGLSAADVHDTIGAQVGKLDLGVIGNFMTRRHQRSADAKMQRSLTTARAEQATGLMLEKIHGEVEILRVAFRQDFSDRIAALAESAAASQAMVLRKLKAVEAEARNLVLYDIKRELDELQTMLADGVIDEEAFLKEVAFRFKRYDQLKDDFVVLMDSYQGVVQNAYQGAAR